MRATLGVRARQLVRVSEGPIVAPSARKHGIGEDDIVHASRNPIRVWDLGGGFTMMLGATAAATILEVG